MTPLVFLDFDGVLNSVETFTHHYALHGSPVSGDERIDRGLVARLNRLLALAGAQVVVSSTWRIGRTIKDLQRLLDSRGFTGDVIGATPVLWGSVPRGREIQAWLSRDGADVRSFVILDDSSDMAHLADRLVRTDSQTGLQDHHIPTAMGVLARPVRAGRRTA
jgi:hypothetical protein